MLKMNFLTRDDEVLLQEKITEYRSILQMLFVDCNIELELIKPPGDRNKYINFNISYNKEPDNYIAILSIIYPSQELYIPRIDSYKDINDITYTGNNILNKIIQFVEIAKLSSVTLHDASKISKEQGNHTCSFYLPFFYSLVHGKRWYSKYGFEIVNKDALTRENKMIEELRNNNFWDILVDKRVVRNNIKNGFEKYLKQKITDSVSVKHVFKLLNDVNPKGFDFICFIQLILDSMIEKYQEFKNIMHEPGISSYLRLKQPSYLEKTANRVVNSITGIGGDTSKWHYLHGGSINKNKKTKFKYIKTRKNKKNYNTRKNKKNFNTRKNKKNYNTRKN